MERKISLALFFGLLGVILFVFVNAPISKEEIPTKFVVGKNSGFDLSPGALNFGKISIEGSSSVRNLTITNRMKSPSLTKIKVRGEISDYLTISKNNFILNPNESANISLYCNPEGNLIYKEYEGVVIVSTYKA